MPTTREIMVREYNSIIARAAASRTVRAHDAAVARAESLLAVIAVTN